MFAKVRCKAALYFGGVVLCASKVVAVALAHASALPTGVIIYERDLAYDCYILFDGRDEKTHLIDLNGDQVRMWNYIGFPSEMLAPNLTSNNKGHILVQLSASPGEGTSASPGLPAIFRNKTIGELDWNGDLIWRWGGGSEGDARQHHDWERLSNGHTLILSNVSKSIPKFAISAVLDDVIYEVNNEGDIVWRWLASEHLDELGFSDEGLRLLRDSGRPDYLHINSMATLGENKWFRAGDERFNPGNIIVGSRDANFVAIIEKSTGKVVWLIGQNYPRRTLKKDNPRPLDQISGQHDPHMIPEGLPGAGNILLFDNQGAAGYPQAPLIPNAGSRVLEINPITKKIVWDYDGTDSKEPGWSFYSSFIGNARRLPNGNTLINEGMNGRVFQVTPEKRVVWEYISPYFGSTSIGASLGTREVISNWIYRAQAIEHDWVPEDH